MAENSLLKKLEGLEFKFQEISTLITDPSVISDQKRYVKLNREYRELEKVLKALEDNDILGGLPVDGGILWCATEKISKEQLDKAAAIVKEVLGA